MVSVRSRLTPIIWGETESWVSGRSLVIIGSHRRQLWPDITSILPRKELRQLGSWKILRWKWTRGVGPVRKSSSSATSETRPIIRSWKGNSESLQLNSSRRRRRFCLILRSPKYTTRTQTHRINWQTYNRLMSQRRTLLWKMLWITQRFREDRCSTDYAKLGAAQRLGRCSARLRLQGLELSHKERRWEARQPPWSVSKSISQKRFLTLVIHR